MSQDRHESGFKDRTRVADARATIRAAVSSHGRTDRVGLEAADGRVVAETIIAPNPVPGYDRAAMDGYAVRAADTFGASDRSPTVLRPTEGAIGPGEAARVHTGSDVPDGADAVVMIEQVSEIEGPLDEGDADVAELEVFDAVAAGENVGETGEDVSAGQHLYDPGHRLRPSDLGLLKSVGLDTVTVYEPPTVAVLPTGEELVQADPGPGEVIETNGLTVSRLAGRWGAEPSYRDIVTDDEAELKTAIERNLSHDIVVTTGGSSVGERDLVPDVVDRLGEVLVHGVALKPGHPVALGVVEETPVIMLPGYPVACIINAVQFVRPVLKDIGGLPVEPHPSQAAVLTRKIPSEPGTRTYARVKLDPDDQQDASLDNGSDESTASSDPSMTASDNSASNTLAAESVPAATPTRASGSGVLSSVALADGWVVVPEPREGFDAGDTVTVQRWEWLQ